MNQGTPEQHFLRYREHGDVQALGAVFDALAPELLLVAAQLASGEQAEDLVQATFVDAIQHAARWDAARPLAPWLVGMLSNHARTARRQRNRNLDATRLPLREVEAPDELAEANELAAAVHAAVERLPVGYRQVLHLRVVHGFELQQIAHALALPLGTVKTKLHRGTALLRSALPAGFAGALAGLLTAGRGLAAMRATVVARAQEAATAGVAGSTTAAGAVSLATLLGGIAMQKAVLSLAAALVLAGAWFVARPLWSASAELPVAAPPQPVAAASTAAAADAAPAAAAPTAPAVTAPASRTAVATTGSVTVTAHWRSDGAPAAGVTVTLAQESGPARPDAATDARGRATFVDLPPGAWIVRCQRSANPDPDNLGRVDVAAGVTANADVDLDGDLRLSCTVVRADATPEPGAEVWRLEPTALGGPIIEPLGRTDFAGRLVYRGLPLLSVWARKQGLQPSRSHTLGLGRTASGDHEVQLTLGDRGCVLQGSVLDPDGNALEGATVAIAQDTSVTNYQLSERRVTIAVKTGPGGRFACDELPAGELRVAAIAAGFAASFAKVVIGRDRATEATLHVLVGAAIEGRAMHRDGHPLAGKIVSAFFRSSLGTKTFGFAEVGLPISAECQVDGEGRYRLDALPPGTLQVHLLEEYRIIEVADGEVAHWNVTYPEGGSIRGRVVDREEHPLAGMLVDAMGAPLDGTRGSTAQHQASTDTDGRFQFDGLPDTEFAVRAFDPDAQGAARSVWLGASYGVRPGSDDVVVRVPSRPGETAAIAGRVTWPEPPGDPLSLLLSPRERGRDGFVWAHQNVAPGDDSFRIGPLPPGDYDLMCNRAGAAWIAFRNLHLAAGQTLELSPLQLDAQHAVRVRLQDGDGRMAQAAAVAVDTDGGSIACAPGDAPGDYRTPLLLPGRYTIRARGVFALLAAEIDVTADPQQVVTLPVAGAADLTVRALRNAPNGARWIGGLKVALCDAAGRELWTEFRQIDTEDPFVDLPLGLAPGRYTLRLEDFVAHSACETTIDADPPGAPPRRLDLQLQ